LVDTSSLRAYAKQQKLNCYLCFRLFKNLGDLLEPQGMLILLQIACRNHDYPIWKESLPILLYFKIIEK